MKEVVNIDWSDDSDEAGPNRRVWGLSALGIGGIYFVTDETEGVIEFTSIIENTEPMLSNIPG